MRIRIVLVAGLVASGLSLTAGSPSRADNPLRIMIVGDSLTQGSSGDWTWRYRLWHHLEDTSSVPFDFVGPRDDLHDSATGAAGGEDYADPAFDRDHASRWGLSLALPDEPIAQLVSEEQPDVVVELLGLTDLVFLSNTPEQVATSVSYLVQSARAANPDVDVVIGEVPHTWVRGVVEVNVALHALAVSLDDPSARVVVAETADGFSEVDDTYDNSHPSSRGEVKIAAAVSDALAQLGVGTPAARPLPVVPLGPRFPVTLTSTVVHGKIRLHWSASPGATTYVVLARRPHRKWKAIVTDWTRRRLTVRGLPVGERVRFGVLPQKGRDLAEMDVLSNPLRLRVPAP